MSVNPSGIPLWMVFKPQLPQLPTFDAIARNYDRYRIPRPPEFDPEGTAPGLICWGTVGQMPTAQPMPGVDFNVLTERSRKSKEVRIENPDDPSQYVIADRATEITFDGTQNMALPAPNTYGKIPAGLAEFGDYAPNFRPVGGDPRSAGSTSLIYADPTGG